MKKLFFLVLIQFLLIPLLFTQQDSVYRYFPLNNNDRWKYRTTTTKESYFVSAHKILPSNNFQFVVPGYPILPVVIDSVSGNIASHGFYNIIFDNVRALPGDTGSVSCDSITVEFVFNQLVPVRHLRSTLTVNNKDYASAHRSAYGFGTISGNSNHPFAIGEPFELQYAFIGGIHYGKILEQRAADSLMKYYIFRKGDEWIYQRYAEINGDRKFLSLVSRKCSGDTTINAKTYVGYSFTDLSANTTSYRFLRYDSASANVFSYNSHADRLFDSASATTVPFNPIGCKLLHINSSPLTSILGVQTASRSISEGTVCDYSEFRTSAYGLGLIEFGHTIISGTFYEEFNILCYAKIGGKEYGIHPQRKLSDSVAMYYPLQIGNTWVYRKDTSNVYVTVTIPGDTMMDNGQRYAVRQRETFIRSSDSTRSISFTYERFDTATGMVFRHMGIPGFGEYALDSLLSQPGDTVKTGLLKPNDLSRDASLVFGTECVNRNIKINLSPYEYYYRYSWGIGMTQEILNLYMDEYPYTLLNSSTSSIVYARINGKEFGKNPLAVQRPKEKVPHAFLLEQNFPNPFNPVTTIAYRVPSRTYVTITVFSPLGAVVAMPVHSFHNAGYYSFRFNGAALASGVYFYRMTAETFSNIGKMLLLK